MRQVELQENLVFLHLLNHEEHKGHKEVRLHLVYSSLCPLCFLWLSNLGQERLRISHAPRLRELAFDQKTLGFQCLKDF